MGDSGTTTSRHDAHCGQQFPAAGLNLDALVDMMNSGSLSPHGGSLSPGTLHRSTPHASLRGSTPSPRLDSNSIVKLNVGGRSFTCMLSTLCRDRDSMLARMFCEVASGSIGLPKLADGSFVLDRDGDSFKYMLNYLRRPSAAAGPIVLPSDDAELAQLLEESQYFMLDELAQATSHRMRQKAHHPVGDPAWNCLEAIGTATVETSGYTGAVVAAALAASPEAEKIQRAQVPPLPLNLSHHHHHHHHHPNRWLLFGPLSHWSLEIFCLLECYLGTVPSS